MLLQFDRMAEKEHCGTFKILHIKRSRDFKCSCLGQFYALLNIKTAYKISANVQYSGQNNRQMGIENHLSILKNQSLALRLKINRISATFMGEKTKALDDKTK